MLRIATGRSLRTCFHLQRVASLSLIVCMTIRTGTAAETRPGSRGGGDAAAAACQLGAEFGHEMRSAAIIPAIQPDLVRVDPMTHEASDPVVSVVIPVRNEAGNIAPLVGEIAQVLAGRWSFEVICVNDGSTDATAGELASLMRDHPWLRQLSHERSCGQSVAVRSGVMAARGRVVATLDGDGQNDPAFLPRLIETLEAGGPHLGLVAGQRLQRQSTNLKRIASQSANRVINAVLVPRPATPVAG